VREPRRREVLSWCLFDFANSSFTTLIVTVAFSVYFRDAVVGAGNTGDRLWGTANFLAMLTVAVTAPILGAAADYSGRKKFFLALTTLQTVVATALLWFVGPGDVALAMILYIVALVGFEAGYVFYNAFLPDVATPSTMGRISGWAWAVGYVGGLASLALCRPLIGRPLLDASGAPSSSGIAGYRLSFVLVAAFFLLFALPALLWLRESAPLGTVAGWWEYPRIGLSRVRDTLGHLRRYPEVGKFILSSLFFTDGITTVISFSAIYAKTTFGFREDDLVVLFLVLNVIAFPGAAGAGYIADRLGAKRTILATLVLWAAVVLTGAAATGRTGFWLMASGAAIGMGATQAVGRSFMAQITPTSRESEFFGFYVMSGKFASMFGPLVFGVVSEATGSQRLAVLSLLPFFLVGIAILVRIDEVAARAQAAREP